MPFWEHSAAQASGRRTAVRQSQTQHPRPLSYKTRFTFHCGKECNGRGLEPPSHQLCCFSLPSVPSDFKVILGLAECYWKRLAVNHPALAGPMGPFHEETKSGSEPKGPVVQGPGRQAERVLREASPSASRSARPQPTQQKAEGEGRNAR